MATVLPRLHPLPPTATEFGIDLEWMDWLRRIHGRCTAQWAKLLSPVHGSLVIGTKVHLGRRI